VNLLRRIHNRRAFSLVELLIVIAIFVILLAISVPAFSSMIYSSEQSLADNTLRIGIGAARDAAVRSARGRDAAAVFFYDPISGRTTIIPCVMAGTLKDLNVPDLNPSPVVGQPPTIDREVFVPVSGFEPVQMPRGWSIRGYAAPGWIDGVWYERTYPTNAARQRGNWVFPETGFYDEDDANNADGRDRQTFMVRFEGGTGLLREPDGMAALVLAVNPAAVQSRSQAPWNTAPVPAGGPPPFRPDMEPDGAKFVQRVLNWPVTGSGGLSIGNRQRLLGNISGDTVLVKAVGQVAMCNEKRLAAAIGVRLDPATNSLYRDVLTANPAVPGANRQPEFVQVNGSPFGDANVVKVNQWIEARLPLASPPPPPAAQFIDSDCRIYSVQRYLGTLQEISGSREGQGVSS
jgi:prepilin-type N-terminal cleavage/methylation domain-containing protein